LPDFADTFEQLLMLARQTHKIFAFKPNAADLHGLTVTAPWATQNPLLPPPHPDTLEAHYLRSVVACMKGAAESYNDDDDDDDDAEELLDLNDVGNEHVTIWDEHSIGEWALGGAATVATGDWMQLGKENDQMHVMAEPHPSFSSVQSVQ
jgi:hypothetical protein